MLKANVVTSPTLAVTQGGIISLFLSNVYLNELDWCKKK